MKKSLKSRYHIMLVVFFALFVIESTLILISALRPTGIEQLQANLYSIVIMFIFIQFVYFLVMFYYIPYQYERAQKSIIQVIQDVSEGKYEIDVESSNIQHDNETHIMLTALQKMMKIIMRFDNLKTEKIQENQQRLHALLDMLPQGCLIITVIGEIVYLNTFIKKNFPSLTENMNIVENLLPASVEDELKPLILESMKLGEHLHNRKIIVSAEDITYNINSSIVRSSKGQPTGAIFLIVKA